MATHYSGEAAVVKIGSNTIAEGMDWSVDQTGETVEDTELLDTWKTFIAAKKSWTAQVACHWDETDTNGQEACTLGASVTLNLYPEGATTGDKYYTGTALVTSVGVAISEGSTVRRSISFQGSGALTLSTAA